VASRNANEIFTRLEFLRIVLERVMRAVFQSTDFTEAGYYQSILEAEGIVTFVQNTSTSSLGAPFYASLCIRDDDDFDEAMRILKEQRPDSPANAADWICPSCSEKNPANFEICWKCQTPRPAS